MAFLCATAFGEIPEIDANDAEEEAAAEIEVEESPGDIFVEPIDCISINRLSRTDVVDDNAVLFFMYGSEIYLNKLPHRCPGLRMADAFSYDVRTSQLCHVDVIRVVDMLGGEMRLGTACGLGKFHPISEEQLQLLREKGPDDF